MTEQVPPQAQQGGVFQAIITAATNLTLTNILILALLTVILIPSYLAWRALNDPEMLNKFTSNYEEIVSDKTPCTIRIFSKRGSGSIYAVTTGFAYQGSDRWIVGVHIDRKLDDTTIDSYCETLQKIVDHMRRPEDAPSPTFPNSDEPLIWHYPPAPAP